MSLFLIFKEKSFGSFIIAYDGSCMLVVNVLNHVEDIPLYSQFSEYSYYERVLDFVKWLCVCVCVCVCQFRWSCTFPFFSINVVHYLDWFSFVEPPLQSWDKCQLLMVHNHFNSYWIWLTCILLRIFVSVFIKGIAL